MYKVKLLAGAYILSVCNWDRRYIFFGGGVTM